MFLDRSLETKGGNPCLKKQSLSKLLHIKEKLNLMIFGEFLKQNNITVYLIIELLINDTKFMLIILYNTNTANRQQRFSGFIQRCLYYIFISQNFQEITKHIEILNAISTDHSPDSCSF